MTTLHTTDVHAPLPPKLGGKGTGASYNEAMHDSITQRQDLRSLMRAHRGLLWFEGVLLLVGGLAAIFFPVAAGLAIETVLGVVMLIVGGATLIRGCSRSTEHRGGTLVTGALAGALGVALLAWPMAGLEVLVLLIAGFCLIRGIADLSGVPARSKIAPGLQIVSGVAGIVLAALLLLWFPVDVLWAPGLLLGIELLMMALPVLAVANALSVEPATPVKTRAA